MAPIMTLESLSLYFSARDSDVRKLKHIDERVAFFIFVILKIKEVCFLYQSCIFFNEENLFINKFYYIQSLRPI